VLPLAVALRTDAGCGRLPRHAIPWMAYEVRRGAARCLSETVRSRSASRGRDVLRPYQIELTQAFAAAGNNITTPLIVLFL